MLRLGVSTKNPNVGDGDDEEESAAMEVIAANEDLLIQILLFLPPKSLLRFRSVSKAWLSLISSSRFRLLKSKRFRKDISGLISRRPRSLDQEYDFFPLQGGRNPPFERLDFVDGERDGLKVLQSCNGLLLCESAAGGRERKYYVINPTTKEYTTFSVNDSGTDFDLRQVNLAFDPRKSIHFKLVCIYVSYGPETYDLRIYSSETGLMTRIGDTSKHDLIGGVYWNDAINWIDALQDGRYFNVNEERFGIFPMPPPPLPHKGWPSMGRRIRYYGESNDHLYLICTERDVPVQRSQFPVYEMDRGYSGWSLRFIVDLQPVFSLYPEAVNPFLHPSFYLHPNRYGYTFEILGIVDKDDDEESFLVLTIPGKVIRFNLKDKSFSKILDYATEDGLGQSVVPNDSFQFIESLNPL